MAGIKISALPAVPSAQFTDVSPVVQGGVTYKESNTQLLTLFQSVPGGAGGSNTQIQYNGSGILAGDTGFTTDGSGNETIVGSLAVDNLNFNGNVIQSTDTDGDVYINPNGTGALTVGTTTNLDSYIGNSYQCAVTGTASGDSPSTIALLGMDTPSRIECLSTNSTVIGSHVTLANNSPLLQLNMLGDDGASFVLSSLIGSDVTGTVSSGVMPSRIYFQNTDSTGNFRTTVQILATGDLTCTYNASANNFLSGYATTATAAATTTLLSTSKQLQYFTGVTTQTVLLPVTSTLALGFSFTVVNNSSGIVTVKSSGANTIIAMAAGTQAVFTCILTSGTTAASWNFAYSYQNLATPVTLAEGGTSASLTASNGGIFYSTASAGAILSGTATATQMLQSGASTAPAWSTSTWPATTTINQLLYSSSANTVAGLATANNAILTTNASGVPSWTAGTFAITWNNVSGTTQAAAVNSGYVIGNAGQTTVTLPVTAALGSIVAVQGKGAAGWILTANGGQTIQVGSSATSSGGTVTSSNQWDSIEVVCVTANTTWAMRSCVTSGFTTA